MDQSSVLVTEQPPSTNEYHKDSMKMTSNIIPEDFEVNTALGSSAAERYGVQNSKSTTIAEAGMEVFN